MRVVLFGGTDLSLAVAERIVAIGLPLVGVVTVESRFTISYSSSAVDNVRHTDVQAWARDRDIPTLVWDGPGMAARFIAEIHGEFGVAAGWYHMLNAGLRAALPRGCAGLHASLLPKLRGGAPLSWSILTDEQQTGITMFELGDGVDDGPIYGQRSFPLHERVRVAELVASAERFALELVEEVLPQLAAGALAPTEQRGKPTWCLQREPQDGVIEWRLPAPDIDRLIRATGRPYPGAFTHFRGNRVRIWDAEPVDAVVHGLPGQLVRLPHLTSPCVATGSGTLSLLEATADDGHDVLPALLRSSNQRFGCHAKDRQQER